MNMYPPKPPVSEETMLVHAEFLEFMLVLVLAEFLQVLSLFLMPRLLLLLDPPSACKENRQWLHLGRNSALL